MIINPILSERFNQEFDQATPIQSAVWDQMITGKSIFGLAPTGSGKTLAFTLPMLTNIEGNKQVQYLILAPSQELAVQLSQVIREWAKNLDLKVMSLIGGANGRRQADKLKKDHPQVVVGTLGRTLTMLASGALKVTNLKGLIVDEADEILISERTDDLEKLAGYLPENLQVALFSATDGVDLKWVTELFGQAVLPVSVGQTAPATIQHRYQYVDERAKVKMLIQLGRHRQHALVFFNSINALVAAQSALRHANVRVMSVGNNEKSQIRRADAIRLFKKGELDLLLATDVAARGLDIVDLPLVVNAQIPTRKKTYIHRTGRTGRAGKTGLILNLGNDHDVRNLKRELGSDFDLQPYDASLLIKGKENDDQDAVTETVFSDKPQPVKKERQPERTVKAAKAVSEQPIKPMKKKKRTKRNKDKGKPKWAKQ
ncbi:DEAD/DEAH box helicase [Convivina praedatoris]|uniref:ATP-dependent RNA helicase DeaD n=1 Tax=Convivina praedatoris TaxID=2880963 RepID=A0ABM9D2H4_9LACO|nr:DEAD/DEAH box helicase [Convivina sp. LMG 32447]CAH1850350.1 ATP-dependent RNA helicase DeaD [Convivina sp. LMG 32447]CAH1850840.1 ATP-dependent RNA helicase DeaD [Convivina sp. LMG 32447]CAH1850854.1 ATP-dependent RNA helicase DeaD [Convivina sp. LMG 32447]